VTYGGKDAGKVYFFSLGCSNWAAVWAAAVLPTCFYFLHAGDGSPSLTNGGVSLFIQPPPRLSRHIPRKVTGPNSARVQLASKGSIEQLGFTELFTVCNTSIAIN